MYEAIRILLVEDSDDDAELLLASLRKAGLVFEVERVERAEALEAALARQRFDVILCDFTLPGFSAPAALAIVKRMGVDTPFVVVSGSVSEKVAIDALHAGVDDYVMKDNLIRLGPTVARALRDYRERCDRRRAEEALRRSQRDYESLINTIDGIVWEADATTCQFLFVSRQAERILGYPVAHWLAEPDFWIRHLHPEDRDAAVASCKAAVLEQRRHDFEYRMIAADQREVWLEVFVTVAAEEGAPVKARGIMVDCTRRKQAEAASRLAEERFRGLFENAIVGLFRSTPDGRYLDANPALARMFGYASPAEMVGAVASIQREQVVEHAARVDFAKLMAETGRVEGFVGQGRRKDGSRIWISMTAHAVRDEAGRVTHIEGSAKDVTDRVEAERALRAAEERYRGIFENALEGIYRSTPDGRFLEANPAMARMLGYGSPSELIASIKYIKTEVYYDATEAARFAAAIQREGRTRDFEVTLRRRDGSPVWASLSTRVVRDEGGRLLYYEGIAEDVTDRKRAIERLSESEQRHRQLFNVQSDVQLIVDAESLEIEDANAAAIERLGWSREALLSMRLDAIDLGDGAGIAALFREERDAGARPVHRVRCADGSTFPAEVSAASFVAHQRRKAIVALVDISVRVAQQVRIDRLNRIRDVLGAINATIVRAQARPELASDACRIAVRQGRFCMAWFGEFDAERERLVPIAWEGVDPGLRDLLVVDPRNEDSDRVRSILRALVERKPVFVNDLERTDWPDAIRRSALALGARAMVCLPLVVGARSVAALTLYAPESMIGDEEERRLLNELAADLSFALDHLEKSDRLKYLAYYDVLTGCPNRALFEDRVMQQIATAAQTNGSRAVVVFDLQRFRHVNETLGRHAGDALLKSVARRVAAAFHRGATLARIGGDVFALALVDEVDVATIANKIDHVLLAAFAVPFAVDATDLRMSVRAGIAIFPTDGRDAESLIRNAEAALKEAKQSGQRYLFYAPDMNARVASVLSIEHQLREAIERNELVLHYQPQVNATNGRVVGFEALVRWQTREQGLWGPARFVPIAEELGLIVDLGRWVFEEACRQARAWIDAGLGEFTMAVNVSALQLQSPAFLGEARSAIERHGLSPHHVEIELTESAIMEQIDRMSQSLRALKQLGLSIALDDFGVGYSSLHYLKRLPVDKLKIDQSFVREITTHAGDAAIVRAIVAMGHQLGMKVVAEGVETAAQFGYLRRNHCDEIQGHFFGMPVPAEEAGLVLRQRHLHTEAFAQAPQAQTLLLLDDDANILNALTRLLRRDGFRILTAHTAEEAFAILGREEVHVVVSDQRMPDTSGTDFLNRVKDMYPDTIRMVLSGFTDLKSVTEAINRGAIYKFLTKPWDDAELRAQIREAFRTHAERRASSRAVSITRNPARRMAIRTSH